MTVDLEQTYRTSLGNTVEVYSIKGDIVIGAILRNGRWLPYQWHTETGKDPRPLGGEDLVPALITVNRSHFVNVYQDHDEFFLTRTEADNRTRFGRLACVEIFVNAKEGDGL